MSFAVFQVMVPILEKKIPNWGDSFVMCIKNALFCNFQFSGIYREQLPEITVPKFTGIPENRNSSISPYLLRSVFCKDKLYTWTPDGQV